MKSDRRLDIVCPWSCTASVDGAAVGRGAAACSLGKTVVEKWQVFDYFVLVCFIHWAVSGCQAQGIIYPGLHHSFLGIFVTNDIVHLYVKHRT